MDIRQLEQALARFAVMHERLRAGDGDPLIREALREASLQRFEYCVDAAWKTVKRYLTENEGLPRNLGPKSVLREAGRLGLLDAADWIGYLNARNDTSHEYSEDKATGVRELFDAFRRDAGSLTAELSRRLTMDENG